MTCEKQNNHNHSSSVLLTGTHGTLWRPAAFGDFRKKNAESHVALRGNFSAHVRDDHGARVPEWTPAGVCILGSSWNRSRSRSQH